MPSIWKYLSSPKAELFKFPNADELSPKEPEEPLEPELEDEIPPVSEESEETPSNPVSFAQLQADSILEDAKRQAEEILAQAREEAEEIREAARQEGFDQGVPFDPLKNEDPDTGLSAEERDIGGLGIFMVKKSMDEISYVYKDGKNILSIRKQL